MTTNIIIFAIVAIAIAVVSYNLGKTAESDAKAARCKEILNLPSPVDTLSRVGAIKIPKHYLTRYVRMDKERLGDVNDAIKNFEDEGFTVDDYDADDGIITMTKGIYKDKDVPLTDEHVERLERLIAKVEDEWGEYEDNLCDDLLAFVRKSVNP